MRIYVPATLDELDSAVSTADGAHWTLAPRVVHAVTEALVRDFPDEDEEEREYAAALEAADDSLTLIAGRPGVPRQRLVITLDVPDDAVGEAESDDEIAASAVAVTRTLPDVAIVCVHVDEPEAADDVEAVLRAADEEDAEADARFDAALERVVERDLLWYDWSELGDVPRVEAVAT